MCLKSSRGLRRPSRKIPMPGDRVLTKEEDDGLLGHSPKHIQNILIMGYWTGMRKGEILKLTWDKVDMAAKVIRLEASDTKERKAKTVPIGEEVSKLRNRIPRVLHTPYVFLYFGKPR